MGGNPGDHAGDALREPAVLTPFVPRGELDQLVAVLSRAATGEGALLLVAGEAGVGKSRLCQEAIAVSGLALLRGAAAERRRSPYGPLVLALREYLRREPHGLSHCGPLNAHLATLLPELGPAPEDGDREALVAAVCDALHAIAGSAPTALMLEDLHWADAATLELLPSIAAAVRELPLVVVGSYRIDEIPRSHPMRNLRSELRRSHLLAELTVPPFDPTATARLAANVLGQDPGPMLCAALFDRTLGVPFFVEELLASLWSSGQLVPDGAKLELAQGARLPVPDTVRDAIRLRVDRLSDEARASLQAASTIGDPIELSMLAELGEDAGADEVIELGFLVEHEPGVLAFRHELVREAMYSDTPWSRRRALHRSLAELLALRGADPLLVADHWLAVGDRAEARPLLLDAAGRFAAVHAFRDAAAATRTALESWPEGVDVAQRCVALYELGRCAQRCGELVDAVAAWEEAAAALAPTTERRQLAEIKRELGAVYDLLGRVDRAIAARVEAGELFAGCGLWGEAASVSLLAARQLFSSDPRAALSLVDEALQSARRNGHRELEARGLSLRGLVLALSGHEQEGTATARAGLALAVANQHLEAAVGAHWVLGTIANHWADYVAAESAFDAAVELCRIDEARPAEQLCLSCIAIVAFNRGQWARAEEIARDVRASGAPPEVEAHALLVLGLVAAVRGRTKQARSLLSRVIAVAGDREYGSTLFQARAALALSDELQGTASTRWEEVLAESPELLRQNYGWWVARAATAAARRNDTALLRRCSDVLSSWASRFVGAEALSAMAHVLGEVRLLLEGDARGAAEHFQRALELMADSAGPFDVAHTQLRSGLALAEAGDRESGTTLLVDAYRTFRRLGARPFWLLAAADLELLGEKVEQRVGRRAAHDLAHHGLTRREVEILRRVAVGRTNREIARELFVSPRTVDMHVRNVLMKLGCRTRTEATARAHDLGLLEPPA